MKYCWEYTSDYLEYRKSIGLDDRNPKYFITIFSQYLKDKHPQETHLTKEMTMPWCVRKDSEKSYSYRRRMSELRQFTFFLFGLGVGDFILDTSFLPKTETYVPYIFKDEELIKLFNYFINKSKEDPKSIGKKELSIIYRLIFFLGLRPNEGREIKLDDINLEENYILIRKNKTHKERIVAMSDDIVQMLKEYLEYRLSIYPHSEYLFPNKNGNCHDRKWLSDNFREAWKCTKSAENSARVRVYDLRHRFATTLMMKMADEGKDLYNMIPYMSAYMGHAHFDETMYYIHLLPNKLTDSKSIDWEKMNNAIPEVKKI